MTPKQRILFLTDDREDYLADSVLHGLISLDSHEVVDYPKKELLYQGSVTASNRNQIYGNGFTLYGLLPNRTVNRSLIWKRLEEGYFDCVFVGNVWRQFGLLTQVFKLIQANKTKLALLDGDDDTRLYPVSTARLKEHGLKFPQMSAKIQSHSHYFKRELTPSQPRHWLEFIVPDNIRPWTRTHLTRGIKPLKCSFSIPEQWIRSPDHVNKQKLLPTHIVDTEVREYFKTGSSSYAFLNQQDYFNDLARSRFGITTKRAGWDCLRHYEIAAAGTIACFRELNQKPSDCAPHGLNTTNCISYQTARDLCAKLNSVTDAEYKALLQASHQWILKHTTVREAERLLAKLES